MGHTLYPLSPVEIPLVLKKAAIFGGRVIQSLPYTGHTSVIEEFEISSNGSIKIKFNETIHFDETRPLAVKLNYRNISFMLSSHEFSIEGSTVISRLPSEARAIAIRPEERYTLPFHSKSSVDLYRIEKRGGSKDITANIIDVSRSGLGILLSGVDEEELLLSHDHIWLRQIHNVELKEPIFGRVIYVFERKFKDSLDLKAGISLEENIPEDILTELKQISTLVLTG